MEKWLVLAAIWSMCATCAYLFVRGATYSDTREAEDELAVIDSARRAIGK
ncbi:MULTISPECIES: hypothetical protein [Paraburkholderia]|jgi:hypothetical protein|uniref:Uncharacterized protein n=1 Tax=Paraburkholderia phenazinium TaxID=60549 RepID=A0A1N6EGH4_9BURK|nr:hypothetical protein [Paraburkholderia phenazinium]SIN82142.1 hypothetical protein SAMN05444168_0614 [Paraburkholderia phenazinium]